MNARFLMVWVGLLVSVVSASGAYEDIQPEAEKFFEEKSYSRALELYRQVDSDSLNEDEKRWLSFRILDAEWRSLGSSRQPNQNRLNDLGELLRREIRDIKAVDRDRVWAEVQESLGDYHWYQRHRRNWHQAWPYYKNAMNWWGGAADVELARARFIGIVKKVALPQVPGTRYVYGYYGNYLPIEVVNDFQKVVRSGNDRALGHYLAGITLNHSARDWKQRRRVGKELDQAIGLGKGTDWYDDALYQAGNWASRMGRVEVNEDLGTWNWKPDFVKALKYYQRILDEFKEGESRHHRSAQNAIRNITQEQLSLRIGEFYRPGSKIRVGVNWRNIRKAEFAVYPVDLTKDASLPANGRSAPAWLDSIDLKTKKAVQRWEKELEGADRYEPGHEIIGLKEDLNTGAYVIEVTGGGKRDRELILISDLVVVTKSVNKDVLVWVTDLVSGAPVEGARVSVWERHRGSNRNYFSNDHDGVTDADGLVRVKLSENNERVDLFVAAAKGNRQSFTTGRSYLYRSGGRRDWKIYAVTDRPAYRPGDKVFWKFTARVYDGETYDTPAGKELYYQVMDQRRTKVTEGQVKLNQFGSAWLDWQSKKDAGLGTYRVEFHEDKARKKRIGSATLFRIEEYKLPEFEVAIYTGKVDGKPKLFQLGDKVEIEVQADYYFGGTVADADVEVIVRKKPFYRHYVKPRAYPWFFDEGGSSGRWNRFGNGEEILRERVKTDAAGKAVVSFQTPEHEGQDLDYSIEARVTDAARREIVANGSVKVTREPFFVHGDVEGRLHKPGDKVEVNFVVQDANGNGVETDAKVRIIRKVWREVWRNPRGVNVEGPALMRRKAVSRIWPPIDESGWRPIVERYEDEEIAIIPVGADDEGKASLSFEHEKVGYYEITLMVPRPNRQELPIAPPPVTGSTHAYVAKPDSKDIGYSGHGLELIIDKDSFEVGSKAPVMLVTPVSGRYVLFTVEAESLMEARVVKLDGMVKLLNLDIEQKHVPNFEIHATGIMEERVQSVSERVVVPPTKEFLNVELSPDRNAYEPGEEGLMKVKITNLKGDPVAAEVSFSLYDESIDYIQGELAGDPRKFFYNFKRSHRVRTENTMRRQRFVELVEWEDGLLYEKGSEPAPKKTELAEGMIVGKDGEVLDFGMAERETIALSVMPASAPMAMAGRSARGLMAADAMTAAPQEAAAFAGAKVAMKRENGSAAPEPEAPAVQVRTDFRSTLAWLPDLKTGKNGLTETSVKFADSLTTWKAIARGVTTATKVGWGEAKVKTRLPLTARFQSPRFLTVGDEARVGVILNNNTESAMKVQVSLDASGVSVRKADSNRSVKIPAGGEKRVEWKLSAEKAGEATFVVKAWSGEASDGMERTIPVQEHGVERFLARSGRLDGRAATIVMDIPKQRRKDTTELVVQIAPSMATTMLDALPYLIDYPYGCTEQTLSRFLPATVVAKALKDMGLDQVALMDRTFGGMTVAGRAKIKKGAGLEKLDAVTEQSLKRLYDFQHSDGGWSWWKEGQTDPYMTAYVVWGLSLAQQAGVDVKKGVLERAEQWLDRRLVEAEERPDMQAWMLHALAVRRTTNNEKVASKNYTKAFEALWDSRDQLNAYTRALFLLATHVEGRGNEAKILLRNLENGVILDERPDESVLLEDVNGRQSAKTVQATAHWGNDGLFHRWSDGGVEATAWALRAILAVDPKHELVGPVSNWLIKNRRGAQWNNTRDTAMVVLALNDYLHATEEHLSELDLTIELNGDQIARKQLTPEQALMEPIRIRVPAGKIRDGKNRVRIQRKDGKGTIYFAVQSTFFSLEEPIPASGTEVFVKRDYQRITHQPTLLKGLVEKVVPLSDGDAVKSGDRIKVTLTIESKNHYEYLLFEDLKPAGFESVELRSGGHLRLSAIDEPKVDRLLPPGFRRGSHVHRELRDSKVALFVDRLPEGFWQIQYEFRAETPGHFHALPVLAEAMYVPEIRANSREFRVHVQPD